MTQDQFNAAIAEFDGNEPMRALLYHRALQLINAGFRTEAHLLILATWNFARFRYVTKTFQLARYEAALDSLDKELRPLRDSDLMSSDLSLHKSRIVDAFDRLADFEGIKFTGAAKILHLLHPRFFVMWDRFISGQYPKRYYDSLPVVHSGFWRHKKYRCSGEDYFCFLQDCQIRFRPFTAPDPRKSFAKYIDEFNFTMITGPIAKWSVS